MTAKLVRPRVRALALVLAAALLASVAFAVAATRPGPSGASAATAGVVHVYVKVTGQKLGVFKGDSPQKSHQDEIVVLEYHFELDAPRDVATGQATGKRVYKPIRLTHELDAASPEFLAAAATNEDLKSVVINFWKTDRTGKEINFYRVTLTNAFLTSVKQDTSGPTVVEEDSFAFEKIEQESLTGKTLFEDNFLSNAR
jgi:type VI secretion system secreted protein Hcp